MQSGCGDAGSPQRPRQGAAKETGRRLLFCEASTECRVAARGAEGARQRRSADADREALRRSTAAPAAAPRFRTQRHSATAT
ncbi:hypothetical protein C6V05_31215 [Burkholderia multivorans]|nr:hypothetical protein C6V05_31215 [Burkholderia multivorans]